MLLASLVCSLGLSVTPACDSVAVPAPVAVVDTVAAAVAGAPFTSVPDGTLLAAAVHAPDVPDASAGAPDTTTGEETAVPTLDTAAVDDGSAVPTAIVLDSSLAIDPEGDGTRPDPFDWLLNLPDDWWQWGKESFTLENVPLIGGIGVLTAGLVLTDHETFDPLWKEYKRSPLVRDVSDAFVFTGDGKFQFGIAILFGAYGFIFDDDRAVRTASQVTEVVLACGAVVQVLKHATGRESPFVATTPTGRWRLFPNQIEYHKHIPHYDAYPSGHVATALGTLTVIMENYPEATWLPWVGYPVIAGLATGMVAAGIHWWSDYPLSIALGWGFGQVVAGRLQPKRGAATASAGSPEIGMTFLRDGTPAVSFALRW